MTGTSVFFSLQIKMLASAFGAIDNLQLIIPNQYLMSLLLQHCSMDNEFTGCV